jgi:hypothetical protein
MDRRDLFHSHNVKEYYDNKEGIHERILKSNTLMKKIMLQERQTVTAYINQKGEMNERK